MININLLNNNTIVTLDTPGKQIIKSSASGMMFHNPQELLCVAVGSCIGKHIVRWCSQNKINVETFESIQLNIESDCFYVYINHPKHLIEEQLKDLKFAIKNCDISKMLTADIRVILTENKVDPDLTKKTKPCCGG